MRHIALLVCSLLLVGAAPHQPDNLDQCLREVRDIANKTRNAGYPHSMSFRFLEADNGQTYEGCLTVWRSGQSMWRNISSELRSDSTTFQSAARVATAPGWALFDGPGGLVF